MAEYARLIEIFERLVAFKTVTGDKQAAYECLQYVERLLTIAGMHINRYSSNGYESIVATTRPTKTPKVLLQAHLDVVPASDHLFALKRQEARLVGRGAFDMKYAAACFLLLVDELNEDISDYDFGLMLTTDEEADGKNGVKYLLSQGYSCEICVLPDGGDNWRLETAAKGGWAVQATTKGKTAHGSRPWEGDNALSSLLIFIKEVSKLVPEYNPTGNTMALTRISGGKVHNQIPDEACATFDFRYRSSVDFEPIRTEFCQLADQYKVILSTLTELAPVEVDATLPLIESWQQIVAEVRGEKNDGYALSFGASDARYFAEKGIPSIVTRPDGGGHHSEDEWIDEAGLYEFYECIKKFVTKTTVDLLK